MKGRRLAAFGVNAALLAAAALAVAPLVWMVSVSLMAAGESSTYPPPLLPDAPTMEHYRVLFERGGIGRQFLNSLGLAVAVTIISTTLNTMAGYAFAKLHFRGREHERAVDAGRGQRTSFHALLSARVISISPRVMTTMIANSTNATADA